MGLTQYIPEGTQLTITHNRFYGVDNANDATSLRVGEFGIRLSDGTNTDINTDTSMELRDGYALVDSGVYKNAFSSRGYFFAVKDNNLVRITKVAGTLTFTTLWVGAGERPLIYADTGDDIFISDGVTLVYYRDEALSVVSDPTDNFKAAMPAGVILEKHKSRLYSIIGSYAYYSDPANYMQYDRRIPLKPYPSDILMWKSIDTGVWMSDSQRVYFLRDNGVNEVLGTKKFDTELVFNFPAAFLGTGKRIKNVITPSEKLYDEAIMFTTTKGFCIGGKDGKGEALTEKTCTMPSVTGGTDFYRKKNNSNQYITLLETRG